MKVLEDSVMLDIHSAKYPTWYAVTKWWNKVLEFERIGKTVDEEIYGPFKRIRRRYEEYQQGIFVPSTTIEELNFGKVEGYDI